METLFLGDLFLDFLLTSRQSQLAVRNQPELGGKTVCEDLAEGQLCV